ncbi:hypothetical protein E4631_22295 [Hymenobacter sp. UV11]|uniref:hypothetical protein n=1 Tax=Hymenobacter sp. UV11 TaxID=1849735 RepID=UPI00105E885D|nr:hypothetical protein [Hymenobacter sp. UV11]TDN38653.1 hypothetical protein A8B98_22725 [Hymenobacter sp. UV11]TFZ63567.1 hypothetical protein E4631_22295 [Hymenobacter sp. UV11]
MQPAPQPIVLEQQVLAAHWDAFYAAPTLRLARWLSSEADRPLLRDYLLGKCAGPQALIWPEAGSTRLPTAPDDQVKIIWLDPTRPDAASWLRTQLAEQGPHRFIALEDVAQQPLNQLPRWFPSQILTVAPDVSMRRLLLYVANAGTDDQPESRFQRQFRQLGEAIAAADESAIATAAATCLCTCPELTGGPLAGPAAEVTVRQSLAAYYQARKQPGVALAHLLAAQQSLARAEKDVTVAQHQDEAVYEASCRAIGRLRIQLWLAEAAARPRREALGVLQQAMALAEHLTAEPLGVEAGRQLGDALRRAGPAKAAQQAYQRALTMAEQLGPDHPPASTQAVGEACLRLADTALARQAVRQRLAQLGALA